MPGYLVGSDCSDSEGSEVSLADKDWASSRAKAAVVDFGIGSTVAVGSTATVGSAAVSTSVDACRSVGLSCTLSSATLRGGASADARVAAFMRLSSVSRNICKTY